MEEYKYDKENPGTDRLEEPALEYQRTTKQAPPCQYSIEELRERFDRAVKQVESGDYYTDEELDDFIRS